MAELSPSKPLSLPQTSPSGWTLSQLPASHPEQKEPHPLHTLTVTPSCSCNATVIHRLSLPQTSLLLLISSFYSSLGAVVWGWEARGRQRELSGEVHACPRAPASKVAPDALSVGDGRGRSTAQSGAGTGKARGEWAQTQRAQASPPPGAAPLCPWPPSSLLVTTSAFPHDHGHVNPDPLPGPWSSAKPDKCLVLHPSWVNDSVQLAWTPELPVRPSLHGRALGGFGLPSLGPRDLDRHHPFSGLGEGNICHAELRPSNGSPDRWRRFPAIGSHAAVWED